MPLLLLSSVSILLIDHPAPVTSVLWPLKCIPVFSQCHPIRVLHLSLGWRIIINWVESRLPLPRWEGPRLLEIGAFQATVKEMRAVRVKCEGGPQRDTKRHTFMDSIGEFSENMEDYITCFLKMQDEKCDWCEKLNSKWIFGLITNELLHRK